MPYHRANHSTRACSMEDLDALHDGIGNLEKQVENMRLFGLPVVVAINYFPTDTPAEIEFIREQAHRCRRGRCLREQRLGGRRCRR